MRSRFYLGTVSHSRQGARTHHLRYELFQLLLDLDEAPRVNRGLRFFSLGAFNLLSHYDLDHGEGRPGALRAFIEDKLAEAGIAIGGGPIRLLAMPRMLGFVFNPLSIYYCHRPDGDLAAIVWEVNNTVGGRHWYVLPVTGAGRLIRQSCAKAFFVSPFLGPEMTYDFELTLPGETIATRVTGRGLDGATLIEATFAGRSAELTDGTILRLLARFPMMTLKVVAAIHLEALRMWLKGVRAPSLASEKARA